MSKEKQIQTFTSNTSILEGVGLELSVLLKKNIEEILFLQNNIDQYFNFLFHTKNSCLEQMNDYKTYTSKKLNYNSEYNEIAPFFAKVAKHFLEFYKTVLEEDHPSTNEILRQLKLTASNVIVANTNAANKTTSQTPTQPLVLPSNNQTNLNSAQEHASKPTLVNENFASLKDVPKNYNDYFRNRYRPTKHFAKRPYQIKFFFKSLGCEFRSTKITTYGYN